MHKQLIQALLFVSLFPLLTIPQAQAQEIAQKPKIDCAKAKTTPELKYCSQLDYQAADKKLNQVYQKVIAGVQGEQKQLLVNGQLSWIKFRDNNCDFEVYGSRGGTGYEIFRNGCLRKLTIQRTQSLEEYLSNRSK